jgi:hypothetical protein
MAKSARQYGGNLCFCMFIVDAYNIAKGWFKWVQVGKVGVMRQLQEQSKRGVRKRFQYERQQHYM